MFYRTLHGEHAETEARARIARVYDQLNAKTIDRSANVRGSLGARGLLARSAVEITESARVKLHYFLLCFNGRTNK